MPRWSVSLRKHQAMASADLGYIERIMRLPLAVCATFMLA